MLTFELKSGGSAAVTTTDGEHVTLLSSAASPPGSTLELTLDGAAFKVKVRGCRRLPTPDDAGRDFRIEGRWVSLSRSDRERFLSATSGRRDDEP